MATPNIEWPEPPIPEPIKALVAKFFDVADSRAEGAAQRLGTEIFAPTGEIVTNRRKVSGTEGMYQI